MTEQEWLASDDPAAMALCLLNGLQPGEYGESGYPRPPRPGKRKLQRFDNALLAALGMNTPALIKSRLAPDSARLAVALLRCVFGNPYRPVTLPKVRAGKRNNKGQIFSVMPGWWDHPSILSVAQAAYDLRDFDRLPVLADALDDAGCDNVEILTHLRGPGPHARGCWALHLLLGKS
jgi:hypothetical protein